MRTVNIGSCVSSSIGSSGGPPCEKAVRREFWVKPLWETNLDVGNYQPLPRKEARARKPDSRAQKRKQEGFYYYFFECTLKDTLTAKNRAILSSTRLVRPESLIYTPKRGDEHPRPFHVGRPRPIDHLPEIYRSTLPPPRANAGSNKLIFLSCR